MLYGHEILKVLYFNIKFFAYFSAKGLLSIFTWLNLAPWKFPFQRDILLGISRSMNT